MSNNIKKIIYGMIILVLVLPSLIITLYSYPCQDDFHYAYYGREIMSQGHNIFSMAWIKTVDYYMTFCGCYTSSFLGYFISGIINCNIWGIRIYELLSGILFYVALYLFIKEIVCTIFAYSAEYAIPVYILLLGCFNCLVYYIEHEDFYWFITSVQYLTISSMILIGIAFYIKAINEKRISCIILSSILGFLGSGGALNIAAFCCILYALTALWSFAVNEKRKLYLLIPFIVTLIGAVINGIAPGNYIRKGETSGVSEVLSAFELSLKYAVGRLEMLWNKPVFAAVIIALIIISLSGRKNKVNTSIAYKMPFSLSFIMLGLIAAVIFPVMYGYGLDTYNIICRSNFISDMAIYLFGFITVFWWSGWIREHFDLEMIADKIGEYVPYIIMVIIIVAVAVSDKSDIALIRQAKEIASGECKAYSEYCIGLYSQIRESEGDVAEIKISEMADNTCMINPQIYIGYYDYENEYCNQSIARFYGKKAVYYITD